MNRDAYIVSRIRTCDVLRAIAAGHTTIASLHMVMPDCRVPDIRNSINALCRLDVVAGVRSGGVGNPAIYSVLKPVEPVIERLMPKRTVPDASALERAMGLPANVRETLAVAARGRVVLGVAGLNARG